LAAELSVDGTKAAVGDGDRIRVWDVQAGAELPPLAGHHGMITALCFADRDRTLFSGDNHGGLRRWSLSDSREVWAVR
jgi:WD40 repeat protein